jgi:hypothetical protein
MMLAGIVGHGHCVQFRLDGHQPVINLTYQLVSRTRQNRINHS